jgi:hypothetical protein
MPTMFSRTGLPLWEQLIISRFPEVFLKPNPSIFNEDFPDLANLDPSEKCNLRYGFECEAGWSGIIEEIARTATELMANLHESGLQPDAWIASRTVRQKLGRLNFQGDNNLMEPFRSLFFGYTMWICERSVRTCEITGQPGRMRDIGGWMMTLSDQEYVRECRRRGHEPGEWL